MTVATAALKAAMIEDLRAINAVNAAADIRGFKGNMTLTRRFKHALWFGGRFYNDSYMGLSATEGRPGITINWGQTVEVDVKASQLTLLLGLTGARAVPNDPYEFEGIPRAVVKTWVVQTLGAGAPLRRWADNTPEDVSEFKPKAVREAVVARYPFLGDLASLVPADLLATLPNDLEMRAWGAGQWLTFQEATIMGKAMMTLCRRGIVVLPVHDSLIVPIEAERQARGAITSEFISVAGIEPRITAKPGLHPAETPEFWGASGPRGQGRGTMAA